MDFEQFGLAVVIGVILTIVSGGIGTMVLQPIVLSHVSVGGLSWLISWLVAGIAGYVIAAAVWATIVAILMALLARGFAGAHDSGGVTK